MTATRIEFNAVGCVLAPANFVSRRHPIGLDRQTVKSHILLIQTGIGSERAYSIARKIVESEPWNVVISTGFAGALNSSPIGSLVIGSEVLLGQPSDVLFDSEPKRIVCHPDWVKTSLSIQWKGLHPLQYGRFVAMDRVLTRASQKQFLGKQTGAVAVDMESGAIGQVAQQHKLPFLIIRAISDGVNEDLPVDFNSFLKPSEWAAGVKYVLSTPRCWKGLWRLYQNSKHASTQLSGFFEKFFATIPLDGSPTITLKPRF